MRGGEPIDQCEPLRLQYRYQSIPRLQFTDNQTIFNAAKSEFSNAIKLLIVIAEEHVRTAIKSVLDEHKCDEWTHTYRESYMVEMQGKATSHGILKSIITIVTSKHFVVQVAPCNTYFTKQSIVSSSLLSQRVEIISS